jgi:hypothetical protein
VDRMTGLPAHTPYDGTSKPFTIGLKPMDFSRWIEVDSDLPAYLAEKKRLYSDIPGKVHVEESGMRVTQREVLDLLVAYVLENRPDIYSRRGNQIDVAGFDPVDIGPEIAQPLRAAAMLVAEDLILMRASPDGWRLVAGSLCFPSSWSLTEKFGRALQDIHAPVPDFGRGTRFAELIHRMFDKLQAGNPVERMNWSVQASDALYYPLSDRQRIDRATNRPSKFPDRDIRAEAFIRVERQTLRKLPVSGDILFTIRIYLDPLAVLERHPDREALAASFATQLMAMDVAQLDYKGLTGDRDRLVEVLEAMAEAEDKLAVFPLL